MIYKKERIAVLKEINLLLSSHKDECRDRFCKKCEEIRGLGIEYERITDTDRKERGIYSEFEKNYERELRRKDSIYYKGER